MPPPGTADPSILPASFAAPPPTPSQDARRRFDSLGEGPLLLCDWDRAAFMHFRVKPDALHGLIPYPLLTHDGWAYVSLVAFTMQRLRLACGGRFTAWATAPIAKHAFLNVRTYVRHEGEEGIYFLGEWLPNALAVRLGPRTFGLPYHRGNCDYRHDPQDADWHGHVVPMTTSAQRYALTYRVTFQPDAPVGTAQPGSLDQFVLERYTAFTRQGVVRRLFRVWHEPWAIRPATAAIEDSSLLNLTGPWHRQAELAAAHVSMGLSDVWMSRPRCINGPACAVVCPPVR